MEKVELSKLDSRISVPNLPVVGEGCVKIWEIEGRKLLQCVGAMVNKIMHSYEKT